MLERRRASPHQPPSCSSWVLNLSNRSRYTPRASKARLAPGGTTRARRGKPGTWPIKVPRFSRHAHHRLRCNLAVGLVQDDVADHAHSRSVDCRSEGVQRVQRITRRFPLLSFPPYWSSLLRHSSVGRLPEQLRKFFDVSVAATPAEAQLILAPPQIAFEELDLQEMTLNSRPSLSSHAIRTLEWCCCHRIEAFRVPLSAFSIRSIRHVPASRPEGAPPRPHQCLRARAPPRCHRTLCPATHGSEADDHPQSFQGRRSSAHVSPHVSCHLGRHKPAH